MNHCLVWGKNIPGKGNGNSKGPGVGMSLSCSGLGRRSVWLEQREQVEDKKEM